MAIIILYVVTFVMGAWIYTQYRFTARLALEQLRFFKPTGLFDARRGYQPKRYCRKAQ